MKRKKKLNSSGVSPIGQLIPQLLVHYGLHQRRNTEAVEEAWNNAAGQQFVSVTRVSKLNRGTLEIAVQHTAFIQELSFRKEKLLTELQTALPQEKIKKIRFVIS